MASRGQRRSTLLVVLVAGLLSLAGCISGPPASPLASPAVDASAPPFVLPPQDWQVACQGIEPEPCRDMAEGIASSRRPNDPPLHTVLVRCTAGPCTRAGGSGETVLVFADGSSRSVGSWSYSTGEAAPQEVPPPPPPRPAGDWQLVCQEVPRSQCEEFAESSFEAINATGDELASITVSCTSRSCTATAGRGDTVATFVNGSQMAVGSWEYAGPDAP
jgi:invasion protein IalB